MHTAAPRVRQRALSMFSTAKACVQGSKDGLGSEVLGEAVLQEDFFHAGQVSAQKRSAGQCSFQAALSPLCRPCKFRRGKMVYLGALSRPKIFEAAWRAGPQARFPVHVVPLRGEELHVSQDALRDVEDFVRLSILQRFCSNIQASQGRRYLLAGRTSTARPEQRK